MEEDIKALRCAMNADEICSVFARIEDNLQDRVLCARYIEQGLVQILRDFTASNDMDVCLGSLNLITRLVMPNEVVKQKLLKPMGYLQQLTKLCSPFEECDSEDKRLHQQLHNRAICLIKILVLNSDCMLEVASIDLFGHVIKLCGISFEDSVHANCCHGNAGYPPKATSYFHNLVHGRKLIGKVRELLPEPSNKVIKESKCEAEVFEKHAKICALSVDLYDTATDQDIVIREELIKEKMAWPQFLSPESEAKIFEEKKIKEDHVWADIAVTSVIDGGHFWAHVGGEIVDEKLRAIKLTLQNEVQTKFTTAPEVGDLVCCKTMVGGHRDIYRARVLQVLTTDVDIIIIMLELFAVDYGFKNVASLDCITRMTHLGRKEPFQARLCCLDGVQPPSSNVGLLVNATAALKNLAYVSNASRLQILAKNGVDVLLKLIAVPEKAIRRQAIGAILNLSISFKTRARIGFLGGIKILLVLIANDFKQDTELLDLAVGALRNLVLDSPINRGRCADSDGLLILIKAYFTSTNDNLKQQCLGALKNLVGNSWYLFAGDGTDLRSVLDENRTNPLSLSSVLAPKRLASVKRRNKQLRPGEVEPQPIEKALPSHVIKASPNHDAESSQSQDECTDGDTDGEERLLCPSPTSPYENHNESCEEVESFYVRGQAMPFIEDETHEFRYCKQAAGLSSGFIARAACAFLNAGRGGTVYLGVKKTGLVYGVEVSRKQRDRLRCGVDEIMGEFQPAVRYDKYQVNFVPVAEEGSGHEIRRSIEIIPDVFVIEVAFSVCSGRVYTTNKRRCYFRCGNVNSEYSIQDVRKWVIREQETFYNDQIDILRRELSALQQR
ncbi:uncharacterized protein LOC114527466 [Dendronephthya gigantea]|uniref:uncharacterized protein LOC114527466 n=1 Tax=Dendronephthya gigantea TaxID=151771 RepID=UPI00106D84A6|nr:uncharacterized protein LOC114527466 [Dendronephthya gigantea]